MNYQQLIDSQRYQVEAYRKAKYTITQIAKELGVHKSTISRELKRNSKKRIYNANYASILSSERKKEEYKHSVFDINIKNYIDTKLINSQWSTEQINGRCAGQTHTFIFNTFNKY